MEQKNVRRVSILSLIHICSLRAKNTWQVQSKVKVMLVAILNYQGIVLHEYTPEGQTVNKEYYWEVLCYVGDAVQTQETGAVDFWELAAASWQCSSPFSIPNPDFPDQAWYSVGFPGSLLFWYGSLWFLAVPKMKNTQNDPVLRVMRKYCKTHWHSCVLSQK